MTVVVHWDLQAQYRQAQIYFVLLHQYQLESVFEDLIDLSCGCCLQVSDMNKASNWCSTTQSHNLGGSTLWCFIVEREIQQCFVRHQWFCRVYASLIQQQIYINYAPVFDWSVARQSSNGNRQAIPRGVAWDARLGHSCGRGGSWSVPSFGPLYGYPSQTQPAVWGSGLRLQSKVHSKPSRVSWLGFWMTSPKLKNRCVGLNSHSDNLNHVLAWCAAAFWTNQT